MDDEARRQALIGRSGGGRERWRRLVADVGMERAELPRAMATGRQGPGAHLDAWRRRTVDRLEPPARPAARRSTMERRARRGEDDPINAWIHDRTKDDPARGVLSRSERTYDDFIAGRRGPAPPGRSRSGPLRLAEGQALVDAPTSMATWTSRARLPALARGPLTPHRLAGARLGSGLGGGGCPSRIRTSVHGSKVRCPTTRRRGSGSFLESLPGTSRAEKWSGRRDSNPRPSPWQGDALPTEPLPLENPSTLRWCREPGSNWRHRDFQSRALPTELSRPDGNQPRLPVGG